LVNTIYQNENLYREYRDPPFFYFEKLLEKRYRKELRSEKLAANLGEQKMRIELLQDITNVGNRGDRLQLNIIKMLELIAEDKAKKINPRKKTEMGWPVGIAVKLSEEVYGVGIAGDIVSFPINSLENIKKFVEIKNRGGLSLL
jgi:hypothetical protein